MSTDSPSFPPRRKKHRRAEIEALLAQRDREGLTWRQLSARSGIPVGTLTSWQQKLRKEKTARFVEIEPAPAPAPDRQDFILETASGLRVQVPAGFDVAALQRLLAAVGVSC